MNECNYYIGDGPTKRVLPTPRTTAADFVKLTPLVLSGLTCLGARWKVSTGDEIEPTGRRTLTMRHISIVDDRRASAPARLRKPFPQTCSPGSRRSRPCRNRSAEPPIWSRLAVGTRTATAPRTGIMRPEGRLPGQKGHQRIARRRTVLRRCGPAGAVPLDADVNELAEGGRAGAAPAPGRFSILTVSARRNWYSMPARSSTRAGCHRAHLRACGRRLIRPGKRRGV